MALSAIFLVLSAFSSLASGSILERRGLIQTQGQCGTQFGWMNSKAGSSPCLVVANLNAICNGGSYNVPAINSSSHYDNPGDNLTPVSFCTCSWASYNLISACTLCQNSEFQSSIPSYDVYSVNCAGKLSDTYFPSNITLTQGLTIPFYATTNPTTWPNHVFDLTAAEQIANSGKPDVGTSSPLVRKKTNIGAIVGGVIGGIVVILAAVCVAFYILRRGRIPPSSHTMSEVSSNRHMRSFSDLTTGSAKGPYTTLSSTPQHFPASPTIRTHNESSVRSLPFFSSVVASTVPYGTTSGTPPPIPIAGRQTVSPPPQGAVSGEGVVEPYTLPPPNNTDRKQSNGGGFPIYDSPNAPPQAPPLSMDITRSTPLATSSRRGARYNPPNYEESMTPGGSKSKHNPKQASTDTLPSMTSSRNHGTQRSADFGHSTNTSMSGMGNILTVTNPTNNQAAAHGRQLSGSSTDVKRRPTDSDNFNPRDLA